MLRITDISQSETSGGSSTAFRRASKTLHAGLRTPGETPDLTYPHISIGVIIFVPGADAKGERRLMSRRLSINVSNCHTRLAVGS